MEEISIMSRLKISLPSAITSIILALAYSAIDNVYVKMVLYILLAINVLKFTFIWQFIFCPVVLLAFVITAPFSIAYKLFMFGFLTAGITDVPYRRMIGNHALILLTIPIIEAMGAISIIAGILLGAYDVFF